MFCWKIEVNLMIKHLEFQKDESFNLEAEKLKILQDPIFSSPVRLSIMMIVNANPYAGFTKLRKLLDLTPGNMDHHTTKLENAGFLEKSRAFSFKQTKIILKITNIGREAFEKYTNQLINLLNKNSHRKK